MEKRLPKGVVLGANAETTILADFTSCDGEGVELRYLSGDGDGVILNEDEMETLIAEWRRHHPFPEWGTDGDSNA